MSKHIPVLAQEILEFLDESFISVFDGTLGLGGHALFFLSNRKNIQNYLGTDLDPEHLRIATKNITESSSAHFQGFPCNFSDIKSVIPTETQHPLFVLLDLGVCSAHLDLAEKGFSYALDGPLKMTFNGKNAAETFLNTESETTLTEVFKKYGELREAQKIARRITEARALAPLKTTQDLRRVVESAVHPKDFKKSLPKAFQAIRIAVNEELFHLEKVLEDTIGLMQSGDRFAIISYHSLEDRMVKQAFAEICSPKTAPTEFSLHSVVAESEFELLTKKPIGASEKEINANPRSRSARLRIIAKK